MGCSEGVPSAPGLDNRGRGKVMLGTRKIFTVLAALVLFVAASFGVTASVNAQAVRDEKSATEKNRVEAPLNLAILIQDDLVSRVSNELNVTRAFIRSLPKGSRVMVGYVTAGSLQVRQPFTDDLEKAASSLRMPVASEAASPYNPYVEVVEALRRFDANSKNRNAVLLISDGLDTSRGFDAAAIDTLDLRRAIREAQKRKVAVYSFYAPTVGLTSWNHTAIGYGQSSLNRLSSETGGRAFFQGSGFVTFDSYFKNLRETLNAEYARAY
jgi:hypothetical protein